MAKFLSEVGMKPVVPEGGYFMIADYSSLNVPYDSSSEDPKDAQFVKWMCINKKLAAIPPSAFYGDENIPLASDLVRFCFIKDDKSLTKAAEIMKEWAAEMNKH